MSTKNVFKSFVILLSLFFAACSDDDHSGESGLAEKGVFVFNSGTEGYSLDGTLSFIDEKNNTILQNAFMNVNHRSLGMTVQDGVILGEYLYIAVATSNTIEIVHKNTLESVVQILPTSSQGSTPRDIVTDGQYVYVSMYSGHVSRINSSTKTIDKTIAVGPNPEEMAIANGALYVVNSDGLNYNAGYANGKSVSKITLPAMTEKKIAVGVNPTKIGADASGNLLVLCMGDYGATPTSVWKINSNDVATDLGINATMMTVHENTLYAINAPWGASEITYTAYNTTNGTVTNTKFVSQPVDSPVSLAIDPENGRIFICSNNLVGGFASYDTPGYVAEYTADGTFVQKHHVGVSPVNIVFLP